MSEHKNQLGNWEDTEAYQFFEETGLRYDRHLERWVRYGGFYTGKIDGSLESLEALVSGRIIIRNFGVESRLHLASALIDWYKRPHLST